MKSKFDASKAIKVDYRPQKESSEVFYSKGSKLFGFTVKQEGYYFTYGFGHREYIGKDPSHILKEGASFIDHENKKVFNKARVIVDYPSNIKDVRYFNSDKEALEFYEYIESRLEKPVNHA